MPGISVIVPVYQAEKFLKDCVESVVRQSYSDWELLLIDDGCTDRSPAICDACAAEDSRVRVFHKAKNAGVSEARNTGLREARGQYIAFLDVDDRYEADCLETLWNLCQQSGADSAACAHLNLYVGGDPPQSWCCPMEFMMKRAFGRGSSIRCWETGCVYRCSTDSSGGISFPGKSSSRWGFPLRERIWRMSCF